MIVKTQEFLSSCPYYSFNEGGFGLQQTSRWRLEYVSLRQIKFMDSITLTEEQKKKIRTFLNTFRDYAKSEQFIKDQEVCSKRVSYFQRDLPKRVDELPEVELDELIINLWASRMWGNKQYLVQKVMTENGIEILREQLKLLLNTSLPVASRYEQFLEQVKGLGPASLTEMLCYIQPQVCGIWNRKAREAFRILGLNSYVNPDKYRLTPDEYVTFNKVLESDLLLDKGESVLHSKRIAYLRLYPQM